MPQPFRKILIASLGTRGDVQPYVALAAELAARGAEVVVSTGEGFDGMIEEAGARPRPAPVNYQQLLQDKTVRQALFSLRGIFKSAKANLAIQKNVARALWRIALDEKPDLILFNLKACVMTLAARRLGVPALPTLLQPVVAPTGTFPVPLFALPDFGSFWNRKSYTAGRWLIEAGLASLTGAVKGEAAAEIAMRGSILGGHLPGGGTAASLQAFSSALVPVPEDWPAEALCCGYWFTEPEPDFRPGADLAQFLEAGPPPVYLGFGSMPSLDPQTLTNTVLAALKLTGQRAILASGWGGLTENGIDGEFAGRVFRLESAPHSWLFQRCGAVVHHGGAGTTHEGLRWGKPSLVCPVFADQPFWGAQVHKIGAGPPPVKQKSLTPEILAASLQKLNDPQYLDGARRAANIMAGEPGAGGTADWLLKFADRDAGARQSAPASGSHLQDSVL